MKKWDFWLRFILIPLAVPLIPFALFGELPGETWVEHPRPEVVFLLGLAVLGGDVFLPIPSSLISVFLGARLGFVGGAFTIALGMTLGVVIGYYVGWYVGYPLVQRYTSERQRSIVQTFESKYSYLALAGLRAVPILAEASVLSAGVARMKTRKVLATLAVANTSLALLYAALGSLGQEYASPMLLFIGAIIVPAAAALAAYLVYRLMQAGT